MKLSEEARLYIIEKIMDYFEIDKGAIEVSPRYDGLIFVHVFQPFKGCVLLIFKDNMCFIAQGKCDTDTIVDYITSYGEGLIVEENSYNIRLYDMLEILLNNGLLEKDQCAIYEESSKVMICLDADVRTAEMRISIIEILSKHKGSSPVYVLEKETGEVKAFPSTYNVCITEKLIGDLKDLVGEDNIALDCV